MATAMNMLFAGVTTSPAREFVAEQVDIKKHSLIHLPCVGRWAVPTAMVANGVKPENIYASDLCLFSTLIGYLADKSKTIDELEIEIPEKYEKFVEEPACEIDYAAGVMLVIKMMTIPPKNAYAIEFRRELWSRAREHRALLHDELEAQVDLLSGINYEISDVRDVIGGVVAIDDPRCFLYVNLPGYKGGYTKMYGEAETQLWQPRLITSEFSPEEALPTLETLTDSKALAIAYVHHGDDQMPAAWHKLLAISPKTGRVDYLVSNHDLEPRGTVTKMTDGPARKLPIFDDTCELTEDSVITFMDVDKNTGLYYRDLFVHRLGQTRAEKYLLMLIDGRVVTSCGLLLRDVILGKTNHLAEVYGISVTSARYARLGKLFMLALTSGDFKKWAMAEMPQMHMSHLQGVQTASPTLHHEGKTDRGVLKLVRRVTLPDGGFQLLYRGDFRDDTFHEVMKSWFNKFGAISRKGWTIEELNTGENDG